MTSRIPICRVVATIEEARKGDWGYVDDTFRTLRADLESSDPEFLWTTQPVAAIPATKYVIQGDRRPQR